MGDHGLGLGRNLIVSLRIRFAVSMTLRQEAIEKAGPRRPNPEVVEVIARLPRPDLPANTQTSWKIGDQIRVKIPRRRMRLTSVVSA